MEKVMVGFVTYDGQLETRKEFIKFLTTLTHPFDVVAVTNSGEKDKERLLQDLAHLPGKVTVLVNDDIIEEKMDQVVTNRNVLRDFFLTQDHEWLLSLDDDVITTPNLIEALLAHKKDIVSGLYLSYFHVNNETHVLPLAYVRKDEGKLMQLSLIDVLQPRVVESYVVGLGCVLLRRKFLEAISFRRILGEQESTEDTAFFFDIRETFGTIPVLDTRIRCVHLKFPPGDKRNDPLDPRKYQLSVKKKP